MSRAFAKLKSTLYTGGTGRAMRLLPKGAAKDVMILAPYLIVGPTANQYGLYQVDVETVALHLPMTLAEAKAAFSHLEALEFSFYDFDSRWIWVKEMAAQQLDAPLKAVDNLVKPIKRWYQTCPKNPWLGPFYDRYVSDLCLDTDNDRTGGPVQRRDEMVSLGTTSAFLVNQVQPKGLYEGALGAPISSPLLSTPDLLGEGVQGENPPRRVNGKPMTWQQSTFKRFWLLYPKQVDQKNAFAMWAKRVKTQDQAEHVLARLALLAPHFNYERGMRFVPKPENWIDRERWTDEVPTLPDMNDRTTSTAKAVASAAQRGAPQ
jgi:hypothetical protein